MPAKPSDQIKTSVIKKPWKNGDIYILERRTIYDPEKKYTRILSTKLISKIPKGSDIPVATRSKRSKKSNRDIKPEMISAKGTHVRMMDIINHIGAVSGIDGARVRVWDADTLRSVCLFSLYRSAIMSI